MLRSRTLQGDFNAAKIIANVLVVTATFCLKYYRQNSKYSAMMNWMILEWMNESIESIYEEYRPWYRPISTESVVTTTESVVTTTDTEVVATETEQRASAYVSRKRV